MNIDYIESNESNSENTKVYKNVYNNNKNEIDYSFKKQNNKCEDQYIKLNNYEKYDMVNLEKYHSQI